MGAKEHGTAPGTYRCDRCRKAMRSIGEPHRAGWFGRASRTEMLCRSCMRAARRKDVPSTPVLYLIVAGVIIALTAIEMCFTRSG